MDAGLGSWLPKLPPAAVGAYCERLDRIHQLITADRYSCDNLLNNDVFLKDLGICRRMLLPALARLIDLAGGVPRRYLLGSFPRNLAIYGQVYLAGGRRPFFEWHLHRPMMQHFNAADFTRCCVISAEYLALFPEIRGVTASSWIMDPEIERVSPGLAYVRQTTLSGGAHFLAIGSDAQTVANATTNLQRASGCTKPAPTSPRTT